MNTIRWLALLVAIAAAPAAEAGMDTAPDMPPMMDRAVFAHLLLDQLEGRAGGGVDFRWHAEGWIGNDYDKLWLKTEGFRTHTGGIEDGQHELLYGRALSTWLDLQAGVRADVDSGAGRTWGAIGLRGLAPMFIEYDATAYLSDRGHAAARLALASDFLLTQRLIMRPEIEANFYSKTDPGRGVGAGLADIDAGVRLRYEISRKFAPYLGFSYAARFGETARMARAAGERSGSVQFVFGIRTWI